MTAFTNDAGLKASDDAIIQRVLSGETALFEVLMRRYNQRLYRVAVAIVPDCDEVEDILQEAYLKAFQHLDQFAGKASFATWLTRIVINEALMRRRQTSRLSDVDLHADNGEPAGFLVSPSVGPEQKLMNESLKDLLEDAIRRLPDIYRSVFIFREVESLSTAETAVCLNISEETVRVRLHRARSLLRKEIEHQTKITSKTLFEFKGSRCDQIVAAVLKRIQSVPTS